MAQVRKIKIDADDDDEDEKLMELCKRETGYDNCGTPNWIVPANRQHTVPPKNTLVIVVDIRNTRGAIVIHELEGGRYLDGVGVDSGGQLFMVPWEGEWYYRAIGTLRLGYIGKKEANGG